MLLIMSRTQSAFGSPKSAHIGIADFQKLTGKSQRAIRMTLDDCEKIGLFSRDATDDPWRFTPHPENFARAALKAPVGEGRGRKKKSQNSPADTSREEEILFLDAPIGTSVPTPVGLFARAGNGHVRCADPLSLCSPGQPEERRREKIHFTDEASHKAGRVAHAKEMHLPEPEMHFPQEEIQFSARETYCPWNWSCPLLSNELARPKNLESFRNQQESCSTSSNVEVPATPSAADQTHRLVEVTFTDNLTRVFADHVGKGIPTPKQCADVLLILPGDPEAIATFPRWVDAKIQRIRHPGVLPSLAGEFNVEWRLGQERRVARTIAEERAATEVAQRAYQVAEEEQLDRRAESAWKELEAESQIQRLQIARDKLKVEDRWSRLSPEKRDKEVQRLAILDLRDELATAQLK
jgi:hypothetical protein